MTIKQHDEKNVSNINTIYNAHHKYKPCKKTCRLKMQQLMKKLNECKYVEWHRSNESIDYVWDLLWAHPTTIDLLHDFSSVLIMDCTYKTNR